MAQSICFTNVAKSYMKEKLEKNYFWNGTQTHNYLAQERTLNHLPKLAEWLSCVVSIYLYGAFDCMFLSCPYFRVNPHTVVAWMSRNSLLETSMISESYLISDIYMISSYLTSKWLQYETLPHDHLYRKQILNHLAKLAKCLSCVVIWLYIFTRSFGCVLTTQFNRLVSLVKWLSVHLRNKWLWIWVQYHLKRIFLQLLWGWGCVRVTLQSLKTSYIALFWARSSLTFTEL